MFYPGLILDYITRTTDDRHTAARFGEVYLGQVWSPALFLAKKVERQVGYSTSEV